MKAADSPKPRPKIRRDGWTPERQLRFLGALASTRSVTKAARAAGMSRESAYRLRSRKEGALFAAAWDRAIEGRALSASKGHRFAASSRSPSTRQPAITRANPPKACLEHSRKVTKWKKWKDPRFHSWANQVRDFRSAR